MLMVFCVFHVSWGDERFPALSQRAWRRLLARAVWSTELLQYGAHLGDDPCTILLEPAAHTGVSQGECFSLNVYIFLHKCYHNKENMLK